MADLFCHYRNHLRGCRNSLSLQREYVTQFRSGHRWIIFLLPAAGLLIVFLYRAGGIKHDKGTNLVIGSIRNPEYNVPFRMAPLILITTVITHLFGGSAGREGAALQIGGSLGAANVNKAVRDALPKLLEDFQVVHLCGKDKIDNLLLNTPGYKQFEYIKAKLKDIFAMADVVISRAGANAICELLALKKPNILIPLPAASSRGDQLLNAASFEAQGYSIVLNEDDITTNLLVDKVHELYFNRQNYVDAMSKSHQMDAVKTIMSLINEATNKSHTQ